MPGKISFILDCWTSSNQVAYHGIIARWISADWTLKEIILDLDILKGQHTGQNLADSFIKVLNEARVLGKILAVTTDNASNCDTFFTNLNHGLAMKVNKYNM